MISSTSWLPIRACLASLIGDLNGQINALDLGARRLEALLGEFGADTVAGALAEFQARAGQLMRAHIADLPDGTYSVEDFLDNDGIVDTPLKIALDMTVSGDRLTFDFSRTAAACAGPVNISRATAIASIYVAIKHIFTDVPANAGVLEPVSIIIPNGTLLAVRAPKPVGGYTETILRVIDNVHRAFALAAPILSKRLRLWHHQRLITGWPPRGWRTLGDVQLFGGGHGGHPEGDGLNHGNAPISTATIPPAEILEAAYPVFFRQWALRPDSGGPGRHRGGLGAVYEIELLEQNADVFLFGERGRFQPPGVADGGSGAGNLFFYEQDDGLASPPMASKWSASNCAAASTCAWRRQAAAAMARHASECPRKSPKMSASAMSARRPPLPIMAW